MDNLKMGFITMSSLSVKKIKPRLKMAESRNLATLTPMKVLDFINTLIFDGTFNIGVADRCV